MNAPTGAREAVMLLADISGYTRFMLSHRKAIAHAEIIVSSLLAAVENQLRPTLSLVKREGDASFLYAFRDGPEASAAQTAAIGKGVVEGFREFARVVSETAASVICKCEACKGVAQLELKVIVHTGPAVLTETPGHPDLSGVDAIVIHRLLKNSVPLHAYLLITESARADLTLPEAVPLTAGVERYDDIGEVPIFHAPASALVGETVSAAASLTHPTNYEILRCEIRREYGEVATEPNKGFHFHTGRKLASILGYPEDSLASVPETSLESFAGTGNPFKAGAVPRGAKVVDVGCGAGFDMLLAARSAGPEGRVIGVDMTPEMLSRARGGAASSGLGNVEVREGYAEALPVEDGWADLIISNGVLNLCPSKPAALREMYRVLKPGGALQIGDILVQKPVPPGALRNLDLWTG